MIYGYLRVSSDDQVYEKDRDIMLEYAKTNGFVINQFVEEKESAYQNPVTRRKLHNTLLKLKKGDLLLAIDSSRLTRRSNELGWILTTAELSGAEVRTIEDNVSSRSSSFETDVINAIRGAQNAQRSRDISEATKRAYHYFVAHGETEKKHKTHWGMSIQYDLDADELIQLHYGQGLSYRKIAKLLNVSKSTIGYRFRKLSG